MAEEALKEIAEGLLILELVAVSFIYVIRTSEWSRRVSRGTKRVRQWAEAEREGVKERVCPDGDSESGERER